MHVMLLQYDSIRSATEGQLLLKGEGLGLICHQKGSLGTVEPPKRRYTGSTLQRLIVKYIKQCAVIQGNVLSRRFHCIFYSNKHNDYYYMRHTIQCTHIIILKNNNTLVSLVATQSFIFPFSSSSAYVGYYISNKYQQE